MVGEIALDTSVAIRYLNGDRPIPENDVWIASQCLEHQWTLVTNDEHFSYVDGLAIERW
ncbi:hypothetical protein K9N68_30505 [Kovacikia minuta CCNUW1]|uniref:PIN domain-containing protein n=1 Tax=Kovacikia minuta TaxID=2931930 RepID=UPI001CCE960F|nr:PIN domain-containing protein [Kovacikia minuta]UBF25828.1 hypothetical protein K9N68_30505 [Kovacikia minuta CCNUW1]